MWILYEIICDLNVATTLYEKFRQSISEWRSQTHIRDVIMTYHYHQPRKPWDSFYFCPDIIHATEPPTTPARRALCLDQKIVSTIPMHNDVLDICRQNQVDISQVEVKDYKAAVSRGVVNGVYPEGAEKEIAYASMGTKLALRFLDSKGLQSRDRLIRQLPPLPEMVQQMAELVRDSIKGHSNYGCIRTLHYFCNSAGCPREVELSIRGAICGGSIN